eukprot:5998-Pyramimonas_sp.AAC.1
MPGASARGRSPHAMRIASFVGSATDAQYLDVSLSTGAKDRGGGERGLGEDDLNFLEPGAP